MSTKLYFPTTAGNFKSPNHYHIVHEIQYCFKDTLEETGTVALDKIPVGYSNKLDSAMLIITLHINPIDSQKQLVWL